jgi:hypothetical protein
VLLVVGGAAAAISFVHSHDRTTVTLRRTSDTRASHRGVFDVVASSPAPGQRSVAFSPLISVQFSQPLARRWLSPTLSPSVPGSWKRIAPAILEFRPTANFVPDTKVTLSLHAGPAAMRDGAGAGLARSYHASFVVAGGSVLRLQQLLAELGYLPLDFAGASTSAAVASDHTVARDNPFGPLSDATTLPSSGAPRANDAVRLQTTTTTSPPPSPTQLAAATLEREATTPDAIELTPEPGSFFWRCPSIPSSLAASWQSGVDTGAR